MWQLLFSVAIAASIGFLTEPLFNPFAHNPFKNQTTICDDDRDPDEENGQPDSIDDMKCSSCLDRSSFVEPGCESEYDKQRQDGIFRFSCSGSSGKIGFRAGRKNFGKKREMDSGSVVVCRRRFAVRLKSRRTAKTAPYKCVFCSSRDSSVFYWGVGVGIMYMMSAGKAEIKKLSLAIDKTAKVVQELKTELCKRKLSRNLVASNPIDVVAASSEKVRSQHTRLVLDKLGTGNRDSDGNKLFGLLTIDDGGYASSVLTEEPEQGPEDVEMTQLESELEAELQKLSETEVSAERLNEAGGESSDTYPSNGVWPSELNQKLCHLLIEQQGSQIVELQSELHLAQSKLHEKESELQALKDCVRRLTSLTISDDEA